MIAAKIACVDRAPRAGLLVFSNDLNTRQDAARLIHDDTGDPACVALRESGDAQQEEKKSAPFSSILQV